MKWYRPIPCDHTVKDPLVCEVDNFDRYDYFGYKSSVCADLCFYQGTKIKDWPDDLYFTTQKEIYNGEPDDVLQNAQMLPVFSQRLTDAIEEAGIEGFQFLPVSVLNYDGKDVGRFYIANCLNMFDAFDYEKSVYWRFPDDFPNPDARGHINCSTFVLKAEKCSGYDVFRMEGQPRAYFVSEKFVKIFRKNKFTGYFFDPIKLA